MALIILAALATLCGILWLFFSAKASILDTDGIVIRRWMLGILFLVFTLLTILVAFT
jgi:hypothetical protein